MPLLKNKENDNEVSTTGTTSKKKKLNPFLHYKKGQNTTRGRILASQARLLLIVEDMRPGMSLL